MFTRTLIMLGLLCALPAAASAQNDRLFGTPMMLDPGRLLLDGHTVELWGINMLASDQQCWQGDRAWPCGEEALNAAKHFVDGQLISCEIKQINESGLTEAICLKQAAGTPDLARHLITQGWAFAKREVSGNFYTQEEDKARQNRLGIWTSRFQTAADWREGVPNFIDYEMAPEPKPVPPPVVHQTIINNYNRVIRTWPDQNVIVLPENQRSNRTRDSGVIVIEKKVPTETIPTEPATITPLHPVIPDRPPVLAPTATAQQAPSDLNLLTATGTGEIKKDELLR